MRKRVTIGQLVLNNTFGWIAPAAIDFIIQVEQGSNMLMDILHMNIPGRQCDCIAWQTSAIYQEIGTSLMEL